MHRAKGISNSHYQDRQPLEANWKVLPCWDDTECIGKIRARQTATDAQETPRSFYLPAAAAACACVVAEPSATPGRAAAHLGAECLACQCFQMPLQTAATYSSWES